MASAFGGVHLRQSAAPGAAAAAMRLADDGAVAAADDSFADGLEHLARFGRRGVRIETLELDTSTAHRLFQRPIVRQYLRSDGVLVRAREQRGASWNELFFDLVFVADIARLTHSVREAPTLPNLAWYVLAFTQLWVIWRDNTAYLNRFEANDLLHKLYLLTLMTCLVLGGAHLPSAVRFDHSQVFSATLCTAHALIVAMHLRVCFYHPNVAYALVRTSIVNNAISAVLYLVAIFTVSATARIALWTAVCVVSFFLPTLAIFILRTCVSQEKLANRQFVPFSIEHLAERYGLFTILVLGEVLSAVLFRVSADGSPSAVFLLSFFGLVCAACISWIYFDSEAMQEHQAHAVRRHWFSANTWIQVHLFFSICVALAGGGIGETLHHMTIADGSDEMHRRRSVALEILPVESESAYVQASTNLIGFGFGGALVCLAFIGILHDSFRHFKVDWKIRVFFRILVGVLLIVLTLLTANALVVTGAAAAGLSAVLLLELWGARITPDVRRRIEQSHADFLRRRSQPEHDDASSFAATKGAPLGAVPEQPPVCNIKRDAKDASDTRRQEEAAETSESDFQSALSLSEETET